MDIYSPAITEFTENVASWFGGSGLRILLIIIGAWVIRRLLVALIGAVLRRALHLEQAIATDFDREKRMETFITLIGAVISVVIWIAAALLILQEFGINTGPLLAGAGVLGVGLAFGTQSLVKDFVSGLFIAMENQYRVGDQVELDATKGTVERLGIRTTVLRDEEGNIHFVPNGSIVRTVNKSIGFTQLRIRLVTSRADTHTLTKFINKTGERLAKEKKWRPQFLQPLAFLRTEEGKHKEYIIAGNVKNAYHDDVFKEFQTRLKTTLDQADIKVKKCTLESELTPKEAKSETK